MMNEFNPDGKDIRFIDSHYRDLFRIPDGGPIQVHYSDDSVVIKPCKFIDEYHTQIGNNVFHICQFAELLERNGSYCQAEPEIMGDEAAWQVGRDRYLVIQTCEDGYDYTLFDKEFHEIDGGQLDNPELSMLEARAEILAGFHARPSGGAAARKADAVSPRTQLSAGRRGNGDGDGDRRLWRGSGGAGSPEAGKMLLDHQRQRFGPAAAGAAAAGSSGRLL